MHNNKVKIANPLGHGNKYTSRKRADHFVRRGMARYLDDGRLEFIPQNQNEREAEAEFRRNRGDQLFWNGSSRDPRANYKPGEVRS